MPNHHAIQLRFIRETRDVEDEAQRDDLLKIVHQQDNLLRFTYSERIDEPVDDTNTFTHQDAVSYLYRLFWITGIDEDPFRSVQFFIPGFPSFLLTVATVKQNLNSILDLFFSVFRAWPAISTEEMNERRIYRIRNNVIQNMIPSIQHNQNPVPNNQPP
jgi:hypothetical protein